MSFYEWREKIAYELFEKKYPATSRMPSGEKWPIEKSQSLQLVHETINETFEYVMSKDQTHPANELWRDMYYNKVDELVIQERIVERLMAEIKMNTDKAFYEHCKSKVDKLSK